MDKFTLNEVGGRYHGTIKSTDVVVSGTYPTPIPLTNLAGRREVRLTNGSGATIYLGGSDVTMHDGMPVANGAPTLVLPLGRSHLYAITAGTTVSGIRVLELG